MAFQGSLREFSASDIIQLLATQKKTGCLVLEHEGATARVYVHDGRIVSTRGGTTLAEDPLLRFLRRIGRLSSEQFRGIEALHQESGRDLEDLLLNGRYLESEDLATVLERQMLDDLTRIIEWPDGVYRFEAADCWKQAPVALLNVEASLIEAARRADERGRYRSLFADGGRIPVVKDLPGPEDELAEEESELFAVIDGRQSIAEVIAAAPLSDHEAFEALQRMVEEGWVELADAPQRERAAGDPAEALARTTPAVVSGPHPSRVSPLRELALAAAMIGFVSLLWLGARAFEPLAAPPPGPSRFDVARLREVEQTIGLYQRENDRYPGSLEDLVRERWIARRQLRVNGVPIHYRPAADGTGYELSLVGSRGDSPTP